MRSFGRFASCLLLHLLAVGACLGDVGEALTGTWDLTVEMPAGAKPSWIKISDGAGGPKAEFVGTVGSVVPAQDLAVDGQVAEWTIGEDRYRVELADGKLKGELRRGEKRMPIIGGRLVRTVDVSGDWDLEAGDAYGVLTLEQTADSVSGSYDGHTGSKTPLSALELSGDRLTGSVAVDDAEFEFELQVAGDQMSGEVWSDQTATPVNVSAVRSREWGKPIELFNGQDLSNWDFQEVGEASEWVVEDGVMVNRGAGWNIFTKQTFDDYKLSLEVRIPPRGNSGIYLNGRYEVQVADGYGRKPSKGDIGAIYSRATPTVNAAKPAGEWQKYEITFIDYWATVELNGKTIIDNFYVEGITGGALDSRESEPGPIMFQGDHGPIEYRNVVLTPVIK